MPGGLRTCSCLLCDSAVLTWMPVMACTCAHACSVRALSRHARCTSSSRQPWLWRAQRRSATSRVSVHAVGLRKFCNLWMSSGLPHPAFPVPRDTPVRWPVLLKPAGECHVGSVWHLNSLNIQKSIQERGWQGLDYTMRSWVRCDGY